MCITIRVGSFRQVCLFVWKRQGPIDRFIRFRRSWCRALINLLWSIVFSKFSVALRPQRPYRLLWTGSFFQCCFTSTETVRNIRDGEPRTATSTFAQLPSSGCFPQLRLIRLYYSGGHVCCSVRPCLMTSGSRIILRHCHRNSYAIENPPMWS